MTKKQIYNILKVSLIAVIFMFGFELLFSFDEVTDAISSYIASMQGILLYLIIYLIMVIQVCLIPVPVYVVVNACILIESINLSLKTTDGWIFIAVTMLAYMTGVMIAYFMGYKLGSRAVKWCAGSDEEYAKWVNVFKNKGKWYYALTVLLPIFPDDLLCIVAGGVKMNFGFFMLVNFVCRLIGLITMIFSLSFAQSLNQGGFPWTVLGWGIALFANIIALVVFKVILSKQNKIENTKENN